MENHEFNIEEHLQCLDCGFELDRSEEQFFCKCCSAKFTIKNGIFDFFPQNNLFSPKHLNIKNKYEDFGESVTRKNTFQNLLRKKITLDLFEGKNVLEIGAAEGWLTQELKKTCDNLFSCDIALSYLERAQKSNPEVTFFRIDAHYLPFQDNTFDSVVFTEILEHVYSPYRTLEEIFRVLKPGAKLILSTPNNMTLSNCLQHFLNKDIPDRDAHLSFYDVHSLKRLLSFVGFKTVSIKTTFIYLPLIKPFFYSNIVQKLMHIMLKNFGDKIVLKAVKTDQSRWNAI